MLEEKELAKERFTVIGVGFRTKSVFLRMIDPYFSPVVFGREVDSPLVVDKEGLAQFHDKMFGYAFFYTYSPNAVFRLVKVWVSSSSAVVAHSVMKYAYRSM